MSSHILLAVDSSRSALSLVSAFLTGELKLTATEEEAIRRGNFSWRLKKLKPHHFCIRYTDWVRLTLCMLPRPGLCWDRTRTVLQTRTRYEIWKCSDEVSSRLMQKCWCVKNLQHSSCSKPLWNFWFESPNWEHSDHCLLEVRNWPLTSTNHNPSEPPFSPAVTRWQA